MILRFVKSLRGDKTKMVYEILFWCPSYAILVDENGNEHEVTIEECKKLFDEGRVKQRQK